MVLFFSMCEMNLQISRQLGKLPIVFFNIFDLHMTCFEMISKTDQILGTGMKLHSTLQKTIKCQ